MNPSLVVRRVAFALVSIILSSAAVTAAEVVLLQSGFDEQNSIPWGYGQLDIGLTYATTGAANLGFANAFTAADFVAAQAGPSAFTKAPLTIGNFPVYAPSPKEIPTSRAAMRVSQSSGTVRIEPMASTSGT